MSEAIGIALLGCGVVGSGVVNILSSQRDLLRQRAGICFDICHVVVRDPRKHAELSGALPVTTDALRAIDDSRVSIVVELMGGIQPAFDLISRALRLSKPVVTANKSLLAMNGPSLFSLARRHNTCIAFEASCGGGIPIIDAICNGLVANRIDALVGIINGTCNFMLTEMTRAGLGYQEALEQARRRGFAESDPTIDVSGRDAAQKLALLASLAFNVQVAETNIHVEGIDRIEAADIHFARELGYVIKLLAIAQRDDEDRLTLAVHPTLVHRDDVLSEVNGGFNAISVYGNAVGHALFYGRGAGKMPTASAVVSDLIGVALGTIPQTFSRLKIFPDLTPPADVLPFEQLETRYYLRLTARDAPGVLAEIAAALGRNGISLSAVMQHEQDRGQHVPVVITTHKSREGSMRQALREIDALQTIRPPTVCLRIMDQPKEHDAN